jgi:bifunctional non-homologous end joining protein LigD
MAKRTQTRFTARMIEGSKPSEMPGFIKPQLATLKSRAPKGDQWIHEIKYDGYRVQIHLNKARVTVYTRNGLDWTKRFAPIADAFGIPVERAIFDGEVVVIKDGRTNFSELQAELASGRQGAMVFYAFDLLFLKGFDLRGSPQIERKRVLKLLFDETGLAHPVLYSDHLVTDGNEMFAHACKLNWEGIISKDGDAPYRSDRNEALVQGQMRPACASDRHPKGQDPASRLAGSARGLVRDQRIERRSSRGRTRPKLGRVPIKPADDGTIGRSALLL